MRPVFIAHRMGAGLGPENTLAAAIQSSAYTPDMHEVDIWFSSDNVPVVIHDKTLDETSNLTGLVSDSTWEQIREADAGSWFADNYSDVGIPSFEQVLEYLAPVPIVIELKDKDLTSDQCELIVNLLVEYDDTESIVTSFDESTLELYRSVDPERTTAYVTYTMNHYAYEGDHDIVLLFAPLCLRGTVKKLHDSGKGIYVWTVNVNFDKYTRMGVDGIITDYPDRLREFLDSEF